MTMSPVRFLLSIASVGVFLFARDHVDKVRRLHYKAGQHEEVKKRKLDKL
jgi:hypothetical protein